MTADTRVERALRQVDSARQQALHRAEALFSLALGRESIPEVIKRAADLLATFVPGATAAVYLVEGPVGFLAGVAGGTAPQERAVPSGVTARDPSGLLLTLRGDGGQPLALLDVRAEGLLAADHEFIVRTGDVLATRIDADRELRALRASEARLVEAQRISHVGSYDFELATNTNIWSDQLYRIYGQEPQSFDATYEKFMSLLHPGDREHVAAIHQGSLESLEPFEMEERIIWPDGTVRTLASWGEVVCDAEGKPARMVGICWASAGISPTAERSKSSSSAKLSTTA